MYYTFLDSPTVIFDAAGAGFGMATGPIMIDDLRCIGDEGSLISCPNGGIGTHDCTHAQDAGLRCATRKLLSYDVVTCCGMYISQAK